MILFPFAEEQFENDAVPPSLVVISPQNFSSGQNQQHPTAVSVAPASHHGQTISIVPAPALSAVAATTTTIVGGREFSNNNGTTGLDLSHVEFVHNTSGGALSSNQKSTNSFEMTTSTTNLSKSNLVNPLHLQQSSSVFVNRKGYAGLDLVHTSSASSVIGGGSYKLMGSENNCGPPLPPPPTSTTTIESIMKSTNLVSAGKTQPLLANGLLSASVGGALHFQHGLPLAAAADKPEDLSSHLTFNLSSLNGYPVGGESVNLISKTTGTTLVGGSKPIINLGDLSIDPQQLQEIQQQQQQQSLYQSVYQKGVMTPASATSSGRRRTTSNNSTGYVNERGLCYKKAED